VPVYFAGGEDGDFTYFNGTIGGAIGIDTSTSAYRPSFCRCALSPQYVSGPPYGDGIMRATLSSPQSSFWNSFRLWYSGVSAGDEVFWACYNPSGTVFLYASGGGGDPGPGYIKLYLGTPGSGTLLVTTGTVVSVSPSVPDKVDFEVSIGTSGTVNIYVNGTLAGTYTGNTGGSSTVAYIGYSKFAYAFASNTAYSEIIIRSASTLSLVGLNTLAPTGNGTTQQWTGSSSNVGGTLANQSTPDFTTAVGELQEYTCNSPFSGTFTVSSVTLSLQAELSGSPSFTSVEPTLVVGGSTISSAAETLSSSWSTVQAYFGPSESNVVALTQADIGSGFQLGYKSAA
jgi:hypothetical protein